MLCLPSSAHKACVQPHAGAPCQPELSAVDPLWTSPDLAYMLFGNFNALPDPRAQPKLTQCAVLPDCAGSLRPATSSCSVTARATCSTSGPGTGLPLPPDGTGRRAAARLWQTSLACSRSAVWHDHGIAQLAGQRQVDCRGQQRSLHCFARLAHTTAQHQIYKRVQGCDGGTQGLDARSISSRCR